jgi:uncharacterized membrane protein
MQLHGILLGLGAAFFQSLSYVGSRRFMVHHPDGAWRLLVWGHLIMGAMSLMLLPFGWSAEMPPPRNYLPAVCGAGGFYLAGQAGFFLLIRRTEASCIAPLLALKIVILAAIAVVFLHQPLSLFQWLAAGLCVAAAFLLTQAGTAMSPGAISLLLFVCLGYSLSDLSIAAMVRGLRPLSLARASVLGVWLTYLLCGLGALLFIPATLARRQPGEIRRAVPFAAAWFISMMLLYGCFATVGPVFGNILQSTRGLMSIVLGVLLAHAGYLRIEGKITRRVLAQRVAAAFLMCVAVWLFQRK